MENKDSTAAISKSITPIYETLMFKDEQQQRQEFRSSSISTLRGSSDSLSDGYPCFDLTDRRVFKSWSQMSADAMTAPRQNRSVSSTCTYTTTAGHSATSINFEVPEAEVEKWPRVAVTPSMLYSYAHMKGETPDRKNDVLHSALFPGVSRHLFDSRIWLPIFEESLSIDGLPPSATYYWDPITSVELPLQHGIQDEIVLGLRTAPASPPSASYEEHLNRHPPPDALKKYEGEEVYGNFGYVKINKTWVDPDSEGQLHNAYLKAGKDATAAYGDYLEDCTAYNTMRIGKPGRPPFRKPETSADGIMTSESEDQFYKDFVEYVNDEEDGEGDPRAYRISPKTFARWATGSKFPKPHNGAIENPEPRAAKTRDNVTEKAVRSRKINRTMQFDMETGSTMTGVYDVEDEPSLLEEAEGVGATRPPSNYNRMNPLAGRELHRQAYGPAWFDQHQRDVNLPPASSKPETFTSEEGIEMMAQPGQPETGIREYHGAKELIESLQWEANQTAMQNWGTFVELSAADNHRSGLQQQVQFLKARVKEKTQISSYLPQEAFVNESQLEVIPSKEPPSPAAVRKSRRQKEYKRHVAESLATQAIETAKHRVTQVRLKTEMDDILSEIMDLTRVKAALLQHMGVETVEEIPNLIPRRRDAGNDLRAQFNARLQNQ